MTATSPQLWQRTYPALFRSELALFLREPFAILFTLVVPLGMLLIMGASFGNEDAGNGHRVSDIQVPSLAAIVVAYVALGGVPIVFAEYRELGVFRAYRVTPMRLRVFIAAHVTVYFLMCAGAAALAAVVTWGVFGLRFGGNGLLLAMVGLASSAALFAIGYLVAALPIGSRTAQAVGSSLYFVFIFTSGATVPRDQFPEALDRVVALLPMTVVVELLHDGWIGTLSGARAIAATMALLIVAATSARLAARFFRPG